VSRRHIVLISQIPLWSMGKAVGGPALSNTLRALGQHYRVSLVTPQLDYVEHGDLPEGVELHEFRHYLHGAFRQVRKVGWITDTLAWFTFRWSAWPIVQRLFRDDHVDLVYGYEIYGVPVAARAAKRFGVPMVARYQGTLMSSRRHERLAGLRYYKHLAALRKPADLYVMTDDGTLGDEVLLDLGHPGDKILFLMNGVDRSILDAEPVDVRAPLGIGPDTPLLLTVSRLNGWKRVDRAIDALAELDRRGSSAHLAVVGVGSLEGRLRELAAQRGLGERVHFVGGVPRDELAGYYRAASMLLSLYDYSNLANPVIEAMLLGCPVLALDVGGTDHLVQDGVNGVLLSDPDPVAIADQVAARLADGAGLRDLGQRASVWANENLWTWDERMAAEIERIDALMPGSAGPLTGHSRHERPDQ
jgi:glycosyltransferase involved in cell wall biosynthesis